MVSVWQRCLSARHAFGFWLRNRDGSAQTPPSLAHLCKAMPSPPAPSPQATEAQTALALAYPALSAWPQPLPAMVQAESLTLLHHLHTQVAPQLAELPLPCSPTLPLRWLDVGSKNAAYALGISTFYQQHLSPHSHGLALTTLELDAGRRYHDGYTRADYARTLLAHTQAETRYLHADVLHHHERYHVISWLLPFVFAEPHMAWGLPLRYFKPQAMAHHVASLLEPHGLLVCLYLTLAEAEAHAEALAQAPTPLVCLHRSPVTDLWLYPTAQRHLALYQRRSTP
jgi:hypothetical protein